MPALRRSKAVLEQALAAAATDPEKALAHYNLALFHDNNGRESEAIPHYETALDLGLPRGFRARCLAFLASSLYKTGRLEDALVRLEEASAFAEEQELTSFIAGLMKRIQIVRAMARSIRPS